MLRLFLLKYQANPMTLTISSVAGKAHHTPFMPKAADNKNAIGRIMTNPRKREITWAGRGTSVEVK